MLFKRVRKRITKGIISICGLLVCIYFINPDIITHGIDIAKDLYLSEKEHSLQDAVSDSLKDNTINQIDDYFNKLEEQLSDIVPGNVTDGLQTILKNSNNFEQVSLIRVVDGDTLIVTNEEGKELKIRLIGIDTPESVHSDTSKNTEYGSMASDYTKSILKEYNTLYLSYDTSKTDQYGRTLAYVWLKEDVDVTNISDISKWMLNGKLLSDGYAINKEYPPNTSYADFFEEIKEKASEKSIGLWSYEGFVKLLESEG